MFLLNDPYQGGTHLPDFYLFKPIFVGERAAVGWSVSIGHQTDVGGKTAGRQRLRRDRDLPGGAARSRRSSSTRRGRPVDVAVRAPREERARAAPGPRRRAGPVRRLPRPASAATSRWSSATASTSWRPPARALLDQAERLARNAIAAMPDGRLHVHRLHRRGRPRPRPDPIAVTITVARRPDDRRLRGHGAPGPRARSTRRSRTRSPTVYACVRHLIGGDPPNNEGYFRPIEVRAPAGTVVNPVLPASVAARGLTGFRIANAVFGALAKIAPDRVFACESGGDTGISYGGYDPDGRPFVFIEFLYGVVGRAAGPRRRRRAAAARSSTSRTTRSRSSSPSSRC